MIFFLIEPYGADEVGEECLRAMFSHNPGGEFRPRGFFYLDSL